METVEVYVPQNFTSAQYLSKCTYRRTYIKKFIYTVWHLFSSLIYMKLFLYQSVSWTDLCNE